MKTATKDYYKILGVPKNAADQEIKKAFRKLAMEHHPDHNRDDPEAEEKFKEITEAYGVLMDPVKRREYDNFRSDYFTGRQDASSRFNYSQQDIFENMFRQTFGRDIFEELNKEFSRSGYRAGNSFFETLLFGGVAGSLGRLLGMIPGPIGKLGYGLRVLQALGSSLIALNQMRKAGTAEPNPTGETKPEPSVLDSLKGFFGQGGSPATGERDLNIHMQISILPEEARLGTKKKISYKANDGTEQLAIQIPPGIRSGGKLRLKEKGLKKNDRRGDLILSIKVESP
ncbi:MAG: J domain-containing protein [Nitrospinae bacterium]|nr:J domain-containing protein [Nitrospinota bacterium]